MVPISKSVGVDFLGFLRGQLQGLQGISTLCYELIQNADDVKDEHGQPGASRIVFDVRDDALRVQNDGVFREEDFERMQKISSGGKRQEADTTGAFGIGFISVYQITDHPEIFSSGQHWVFHPEADEKNRALVDERETKQTRFRLPWAFEGTPIRQQLQVPPVNRSDLEQFTDDISRAIEHAALFLRQITTLEVRRNGELRRKIEVVKEENQYLIADGQKTTEWRIFRGDFDDLPEYHALREKFGGLLDNRKTEVRIALPEKPLENGLLYAFLPSDAFTGLPFHINADFFPSPDRKRILLGSDYQSDWNRLALECATQTLARSLDELLSLYSDLRVFWKFLAQVRDADESGPLKGQIPVFWKQLYPGVSIRPTVLTTGQKKMRPRETFYPRGENAQAAADIFEDLGLPVLHEYLREFQNLLTSRGIGVKILTLQNVLDAMERANFRERRNLSEFPPTLKQRENWPILWKALESLGGNNATWERLQHFAIVFGEDGRLYPPAAMLYKNEADVRAFFSAVTRGEVVWMSSQMSRADLPGSLVAELDLEHGLDILEQHADELPAVLQNPEHLATLYAWLSIQERVIRQSPASVERIRALPIGPLASGDFKPLAELYLTGEFEDPLRLAAILDTSQLPGRKDFVREILGLRVLSLETYVAEQVPYAWQHLELGPEKREQLIRFLSAHLSQLKGGDNLRETLAQIPLVLCEDGEFRRANEAYFNSDAIRAVMGDRVTIVKEAYAQDEAIHDFYAWLGVSDELRPSDLLQFVRSTVARPPDEESIRQIAAVFRYLAERWAQLDEEDRKRFAPLKSLSWLPGSGDTGRWFLPHEVYADFQKYLFESQGNFLIIDRATQNSATHFMNFLGIKDTPELHLVVRHLRFCSKKNRPVNLQVYRTLNNNVPNDEISPLLNVACLYIETESGESQYYHPYQVFLNEHPFGTYRLQLPKDFFAYRDFLEAVGVKEKPDYQDAIAVLQEIGQSQFVQSHLSIEGTDDERVLYAAWEMLNEAFLAENVTAEELSRQLRNCKCIPNRQEILYEPERLFFEDRPGWAKKFSLVKDNIAPRKDGVWQAMQAAGVRRLSDVVATAIADLDEPRQDAANVAGILAERAILLRRVLDAPGQSRAYQNKFDAIAFFQASKIVTERVLRVFNRNQKTNEEVNAVYLPEEKELYYVSRGGRPPWSAIARELGYAMGGDGDISTLLIALEKILGGPSFADVNRDFDNLGLPPLEDIPVGRAEPAVAHSWGEGGETDADLSPDAESPLDTPPEQPQSALPPRRSDADSRLPPRPKETEEPRRPPPSREHPRVTKRLLSYVLPPRDEAESDRRSGSKSRNQEIGQRGVDIVMEFERRQGRQPEDMNVENPNNPGYDVKSYAPDTKEIRFIEVKALTQKWDGRNPARVTSSEFEMAMDRGENYWLYIVEEVESETPTIYCIQNPARQVQYFCYDHGWMDVSIRFEGNIPEKGDSRYV